MPVGQHSMGVIDTVRHGSKQVIYEGYPEFGYNHPLTDLHAAIGVSNCNGFPTRNVAGAAQYGESAFATSPNWKRLPSLAGLAATGKATVSNSPTGSTSGAVSPGREGRGPLPYCDTEAMREHVAEISRSVDDGRACGAHLDQAGSHVTPKLKVSDNITLLLPPRSPGAVVRRPATCMT